MSRKPGTLCRFTCCCCSAVVMTGGGTTGFRCASCVDKFGGREVWSGKERAGLIVSRAVKNGFLVHPSKFACTDCQRPAVAYDHRDYNEPLRVEPVCTRCNRRRGPALPLKGYFAKVFERGWGHYTSRAWTVKLFKAIGIDIDFSHLPASIEFVHWLPFKNVLLEWDGFYQREEQAPA